MQKSFQLILQHKRRVCIEVYSVIYLLEFKPKPDEVHIRWSLPIQLQTGVAWNQGIRLLWGVKHFHSDRAALSTPHFLGVAGKDLL